MEASQPRKRLRRSTRSCYPCRKRKVKCQLTDENVKTCAECEKSGIQCTSQSPETEPTGGSSTSHADLQDHAMRLNRIESLLKVLVEVQDKHETVAVPSEFEPPISAPPWEPTFLNSVADEAITITEDHGLAISQPLRLGDDKQSLLALLPSAQDAVDIVTNTTAWLWGAETPHGSVLTSGDALELLEVDAIARGDAMQVAKALLLYALYMQQLAVNIDLQSPRIPSVKMAIELIIDRVKLFVLSLKPETYSIDSLECLTLVSLIHLNDGDIRMAWMTFRNLLDAARLKKLQQSFSESARNSLSSQMALHRRLWLAAVCGDCYCSLLLGVEPALGIAPFGPDDSSWNDPLADENANIQRRICLIVARVAQRNAVGIPQDHQTLHDIDEALDRLKEAIPSSWWRAPLFRQDRSLDSAYEPNRLICQLWFLQARAYAHMPIAFGKPTNDSLKSLEVCMEASRMTLQRYLVLQHAKDQLSRCRSIDQSVFVGSVVLILAQVQLRWYEISSKVTRYDSDGALLEQVIDSFQAIGEAGSREHVAKQIYEILSTMFNIANANSEKGGVNASVLPGSNDTLVLGLHLNSEDDIEGAPSTTKFGMEDIIASSIQPLLDTYSPASRLLNLLFRADLSVSVATKHNREPSHKQAGLELHNLIDPTILQ